MCTLPSHIPTLLSPSLLWVQSQRWPAQSSRISRTLSGQGPEVSDDWDSSVRVCNLSPASLGPLWAGRYRVAHPSWQVAQPIFAYRHLSGTTGQSDLLPSTLASPSHFPTPRAFLWSRGTLFGYHLSPPPPPPPLP